MAMFSLPGLARAVPGPLEPTRTRLRQELRQTSPLLGCRLTRKGVSFSPERRTTPFSAGNWRQVVVLPWPGIGAG